jgi:hypothetical protein
MTCNNIMKIRKINMIVIICLFVITNLVIVSAVNTNNWQDFYGNINGAKISDKITAVDTNGVICGQFTINKAGQYGFMHVYSDDANTNEDEGAKVGDIITFYYNGMLLSEKATYKGNRELTRLDLTIAVQDSDGDKVINSLDLCSNTPKRTSVDKNGCSALQFCNLVLINSNKDNSKCTSADWRANEPKKKNPGDCKVVKNNKTKKSSCVNQFFAN